jgi:hypothetical protein
LAIRHVRRIYGDPHEFYEAVIQIWITAASGCRQKSLCADDLEPEGMVGERKARCAASPRSEKCLHRAQRKGAQVECTVKNISDGGAALQVSTTIGIPKTFDLILTGSAIVAVRCGGLTQNWASRLNSCPNAVVSF